LRDQRKMLGRVTPIDLSPKRRIAPETGRQG
jgi:hypothetical protein